MRMHLRPAAFVVMALGLFVGSGLAEPAGQTAQPPVKPAIETPAPAGAIDGKWTGTVESPQGMVDATADLKTEGGVIKGSMIAGPYSLAITGGTVQGNKVALTFVAENMDGRMAATLENGVIRGTWEIGDMSGAFTLKRGEATSAAKPAGAATAGAAKSGASSEFAGEWEASASVGGQTMPFVLSIKVDGEKVTGTVASAEGTLPIEGTVKDGVLSFSLTRPEGMTIVMSAKVDGSQLAGSFDVGGQMTGPWSATRKK